MTQPKATPMIRQYLSIKEQHADAILFYRMGDFYEMFFEDAEIASRALEITLTSRNKNDEVPVPMCGVPYRAAQGYVARLIEKGYKVAICDQVEDPATAKGIVKRDVIRVVTPGMIFEDELLDRKANNYLLACFRNRSTLGIAYLDISTGTFRATESREPDRIVDEALRVAPREILLPESAGRQTPPDPVLAALGERPVTFLPDRYFDPAGASRRLLEQFKTVSLEGFGLEGLRAACQAAGALVQYVQENQKQPVQHLTGIETYALDRFLVVDEQSCRNLELLENIRSGTRQGTFIEVMDRTVTPMGGRMLRQWIRYPLLDIEPISARHDAVAEAKNDAGARRGLREQLRQVQDLERLGARISMGRANARDLTALKRSIRMVAPIVSTLEAFGAPLLKPQEATLDLAGLDRLAGRIDETIREDAPPTVHEGGIVKSGLDAELDELVQISRDGRGWLARLEAAEREATGIGSLKVRYNKVFGYYIEVPRAHSAAVPPHYVRKQTLVNAERYITDTLKEFENKVLGAEDRRTALEYDIFVRVREEAAGVNPAVQAAARFLALLDCLLSLAEVADHNGYRRPEINTEGRIDIQEGRHPVIEKMITGERFVPNSIRLDNEKNQVLIITGPNMAGKSTVLRQVALLVLMAQMGSFVPAGAADISLTDRIFTRVGALDNLSQGQSTFMVEMQETARILNSATGDSLVIMDEIGRGTSTYDGISIAWAVAEHLHELKAAGVKTLFATHYHELTELALTKARVKNYNIAVKEWNDEIIFLRKLVEGGTNRSYGIQVARLAGIPPGVIRRAKKILAAIESGEHSLGRFPAENRGRPEPPRGQVQLELFRRPADLILERLERIDISRLTPLEALNCLDELKEIAAGRPTAG